MLPIDKKEIGPNKSIIVPPNRDDVEDQMHKKIVGNPFISDINVGSVMTVCLVDTGGVISTATEEFVLEKLLCLVIKDISYILEHERFESASGESMKFEGYIVTDIEVPAGKKNAVLLIVKSTVSSRQVLIGTNVLMHLLLHRVSSLWKSSTQLCINIYNMAGVVYCQRQPVSANSEVTLEGRAKMTTAKFPEL